MTRALKTFEVAFGLPADREQVFQFVSNVEHLDLMTPPWLRFTVKSPGPHTTRLGAVFDYRLRWRRLPMLWRSEITDWQPHRVFTYEQRRGPYRRWIHEHYFEDRDGGTWIVDRVRYALHLPVLPTRWVERDIATIFNHRVGVLSEIFSTPRSQPTPEPLLPTGIDEKSNFL